MNLKNTEATQFQTGSEQVEIARKGGKASGRARRERKTMRETAEYYLNLPQKKGKVDTMDRIKNGEDIKTANLTYQDQIILKHIDQARKGNNRSAEFILDLIGEKVERQEVTVTANMTVDLESADINQVLAEVRKLKNDVQD